MTITVQYILKDRETMHHFIAHADFTAEHELPGAETSAAAAIAGRSVEIGAATKSLFEAMMDVASDTGE